MPNSSRKRRRSVSRHRDHSVSGSKKLSAVLERIEKRLDCVEKYQRRSKQRRRSRSDSSTSSDRYQGRNCRSYSTSSYSSNDDADEDDNLTTQSLRPENTITKNDVENRKYLNNLFFPYFEASVRKVVNRTSTLNT